MPKLTIKQKVANNAAALAAMGQPELTAWAKANDMDSRAGFAAFKKALLAIDINYDVLASARREAEAASRQAAATHSVLLYSDAKARLDRFGITDGAGNPVWHGRFFDNDRDYNGEQSSGELAAAKKRAADRRFQGITELVRRHGRGCITGA